jgi:fatty acid desaturase
MNNSSAIQQIIRDEDRRLRDRFTFLVHQDAIGLIFFFGALAAVALFATLYIKGKIYWWFATGAIAVAISILHELEHDLIHNLYFKGRKWLKDSCLFVIWWAKLHANPWWRADQHLHHHRRSGQEDDFEERMLGIGLPLGPLRFLIAFYPVVMLLYLHKLRHQIVKSSYIKTALMSAPTYIAMLIIWESFCGYARINYGLAPSWDPAYLLPESGWPVARNLAVLWLFPNIFRHTCLAFASSYCHYYGDIKANDLVEQTQVITSPLFWPVQLFCFNFSGTHAIHHFVVDQPFYLRQAVALGITDDLSKAGLRRNDLGIFRRNNRRYD